MPVNTRKRISSSQPALKLLSTRPPRQNHGSLKMNAAHAQAAKRVSFAAQTGLDIIANVDDQCVRDILLVQDTQLKKQEKAIAKLTSMVEELKQLLFNKQSGDEQTRTGDAVLSYAAVVGKSNDAQSVLPTPRSADVNNHRHWEAQLRGYTREIRLFVRNGQLSNAEVNQLLVAESGVSQIDGVAWKRVQEGKVVVIMCRDERHRQSVFCQIRKNRRASQLTVNVQCWLSALQRSNKQEIYKWANEAGKEIVLAYDWGDRILLNRVSSGRNQPENRYVLDLSLPLAKVQAQLYSLWTKWGIQLANDRPTAGPKRDRQQPAEQPEPASGESQDVEMSGQQAKQKRRKNRGKSKAIERPMETEQEVELPGPPPRDGIGEEQGTEWHDASMGGDEAGPSRPADPPAQSD